MKIPIKIKDLLIFTLAFILCTAVGTVGHELGHIAVAKSLGYETTLHYGSMRYKNSQLIEKLDEIYYSNKTVLQNDTDFERKNEYDRILNKLQSDRLMVTIGGPLQTILTGTIGLLIVLFRRNRISSYGLKPVDWLAVFLALFWLREVFNVVISVGSELISPKGSYFGGDEKDISILLNLWPGTISIILAIIGLMVSLFIIFCIIPTRLRPTFILSGLIGGILGFIFWMDILGPIVLP